MKTSIGGVWSILCRDDAHAASEVARIVLDDFVRAGEARYALALSGGRSAPTLFRELVRQAETRSSPLQNADFFWADERCVRPEHEESNYRVARSVLLERLKVPTERIHRLPGELPPDRAVAKATDDWRCWLATRGDRPPALDCVLLGMGEDGHVASLFPENLDRDLMEPGPICAVVGPKPPPQRLTLSYRELWKAGLVIVLVTGAEKAGILKASLTGRRDTPLARVLRGRTEKPTVVVFTNDLKSAVED